MLPFGTGAPVKILRCFIAAPAGREAIRLEGTMFYRIERERAPQGASSLKRLAEYLAHRRVEFQSSLGPKNGGLGVR